MFQNKSNMEGDRWWTLHRVPNMLEVSEFSLSIDKEAVSLGRKQGGANDKVCTGPNVSRNHLQLVRYRKQTCISYGTEN